LSDWQSIILSSLKENVELITGQRTGAVDLQSRALFKGDFRLAPAEEQTMTRITARGAGFNVSGVDVAALDDHGKLMTDVQNLANDVARLRATVNTIIGQITS
jgi:hypothetical protein